MDRQPVLDGDRLTLRPLRPEDWDALYAVASDREIWAKHPSHDRWQEPVFRQFFAEAFVRGGALAIIDRATGEIIGSSQFAAPDPEHPDEIEIGWSFLACRYWGKGYNGEFKHLMLAHALAHYERAIFQVGEDNVISRRAMENIGGVLTDRIRMIERAGAMVRHVMYEITRDGFAAGPLGRDTPLVRYSIYQGDREALMPLFRLADESESEIRAYFGLGDVLVAQVDGRAVGIAQVEIDDGQAQIISLAVLPEMEGRGIGSRLIAQSVGYARAGGVRRLVVCTGAWEGDTIAFYERRGFRLFRVEPAFFTPEKGYDFTGDQAQLEMAV